MANRIRSNLRLMPCLDMQNGRVAKGVHFVDIKDAGDPVACAQAYCAAGADEAGATVLLAASVFHFGLIPIPELKEYLRASGFKVGR